MADKSDKQFDPTPQRIKKAREEGNVFKSQEMTSAGMLTVGAAVLLFGMPKGFATLQSIAADLFLQAGTTELNISSTAQLINTLGLRIALLLLPFMGLLAIAAIGLTMSQTGVVLATKALEPKGSRINPGSGLKRIFSAQGVFTVVKSIIKILIVGPVAYVTIRDYLPDILMLHTMPIEEVLSQAGQWIMVLLSRLIILLVVLSGFDFAFEKWRYKRDLKMSKQELKDEAKNSEGNPEMKGKRRQLAREMAQRPRLDHAVLQADVVVTNPTHYAIALKYDPTTSGAPVVLVKGIRKRALRIKGLAIENGIPTVEDRPLARALYAAVEETQEIPPDLYPAVAAVLAEIYRTRKKKMPSRS